MTSESYLNPEAIKKQCDDCIAQYRSENTNLAKVRKNLQAFIDDKKLKSDSYKALKSQVSDYMLLLSGMRQANNADIIDCRSLKEAVGDEVLNGAFLIKARNDSWDRYVSYRSQASSYASKASSSGPEWSSYYSSMASYYSSLANKEKDKYLYYVGKIKKYDQIELLTVGLFATSKPIRENVSTGAADVSQNFWGGAYHNSSNINNWKKGLKDNNAKVKAYPPKGFKAGDVAGNIFKDIKSGYDLYSPINLARHGIRLTKKNGEYFFSVGGKNKKDVQKFLEELTGKEWKGKALQQAWQGQGLNIMGKRGKTHIDASYIKNNALSAEFGNYLESIAKGTGRRRRALEKFGETFVQEINPKNSFKEFSSASKWGKAAKGLGIVGDTLTVVSELEDNFYEDGDVVVTPDRVQNFVTDTAVDFGTSAAATATGAAVGSLFLPPLGTVVGAAVGMGLDYAANNVKISDFDGDGQKDSAVDGLKHLVDTGCNKLGGLIFG